MFKKLLPLLFLFAGFQANAAIISTAQEYSVYTTNGGGNSYTAAATFAGDTGSFTAETSRIYGQFALPTYTVGTLLTDVTFSLTYNYDYNNASGDLGLYTVEDDTWTTSTSWQDKAVRVSLIESFNPEVDGITHSFDLTAFANSQYSGDGDLSVTIAGLLEEGSSINSWHYFAPSSMRLEYNVESSVVSVPEPSIITIFALGLVGIGYARRRRT
jgi:hypothetical protein